MNGNYLKLISVLLVFCLSSCSNDSTDNSLAEQSSENVKPWSYIELPDLSQQPVTLRVANVVNPRFKQLTDVQVQQILNRAKQMVKQYFDIEILFSDIDTLAISDVFSSLDQKVKDNRRSEIVDISLIDNVSKEKMQKAIYNTLSNYHDNNQKVLDYAQPFLLHPDIKQKSFLGLSYALVDTLVSRLNYWKTQTADDGRPVLGDDGFNQWVWWDSLGYGDLQYDVVITNQIVVSAEYYGMDVHSSIRGGITAGTTTYNKNTQFDSYVYIMLYPMLNDSELLDTLRQDKTYDEEQIVNYSAALLTHELGHLLLHLGHPFGNNNCIMSPTMMLDYRTWYDNLDASACSVGSNPDMSSGAVELEYNKSW